MFVFCVCLPKPKGSIRFSAASDESYGERGQKAAGPEGHPWLHPPCGGDLSHRHHQLQAASPRESKRRGRTGDLGGGVVTINWSRAGSKGSQRGLFQKGIWNVLPRNKQEGKQTKQKQMKWDCCSGLTTRVPEIPPPLTLTRSRRGQEGEGKLIYISSVGTLLI